MNLDVFELIFLDKESSLSATSKRRVGGIRSDGEGTTRGGLLDVLFVVVVLRDDLDTWGDKVSRVES